MICFSLLFYSHWGLYDNSPTTKIEKVYLDGSYRTVLVEEDLAFPNELAIDFKQRRLFWADSTNKRIEYCDFFGRSRKIVISKVAPYGLSVVS
jgi:Gluconolactonase